MEFTNDELRVLQTCTYVRVETMKDDPESYDEDIEELPHLVKALEKLEDECRAREIGFFEKVEGETLP